MAASHYWLAQWLDENEIHSEWEIDHALNSKSSFKGLMKAVSEASKVARISEASYSDLTIPSDSIVAGRKLDLSGRMSCPTYDCMRERIDSTFKRVWHYFDQIVVEGIAPGWFASQIERTSGEDLYLRLMMIRDQARLLLYLREIGAEHFVAFAPKSHAFCQEHWEQHARDLGLAAAIDESRRKKTIKKIMDSSEFLIKEDGNGWYVTVTGSYFSEPESTLLFPRKGITSPNRPTREFITEWIISNYATAAISDVGLAQRLTLPLVEPVSLPWISRPYRDDNERRAEDDAVIRVGLPVFDSLSTKDFLKLREDERPAFETFRAELRKAIQGEIAQDPYKPPATVSKNIQNEYLRPGLADIEKRVRIRRSALVKKTAVNLTIGTSAAAIGVITGMPLIVEGIAALGSAIPLAPIIHKYIDDGEPIRMDKFYFLWQAEKQAEHH